MANKEYLPISTYSLPLRKEPLPFDVFLRLGKNKYAKIFNEGTEIEQTRYDSYILKGIQEFHIQRDSLRKYNIFNQNVLRQIRTDGRFSKDESLQTMNEFAGQVLNEIYEEQYFDDKSLDLALTLVDTYVGVAKNQFQILPVLLKMARKKENHLKHAIHVSIFSVLLARAVDPTKKEVILGAGLAGLLHDIGLSRLPDHIEEMNLNPPEVDRKMLALHPLYGVEIVSQAPNFPEAVKRAIAEHHEAWDGTGYPNGKKGKDINLLARIIAVADSFASLTSASSSNIPLAPSLALTLMRQNSRLDPHLVERFSKMLNL